MQRTKILNFIQNKISLKAIPRDVKITDNVASTLPNVQTPPKYTLVSLKSFPSLEPTTCIPVSTSILGVPLRRDILWRAVVYENDNRRVGASNPPGRSDNGYSRRKLRPQKGTGHARVGDANSPTRHKGGRALARNAPNDYSTELPKKIYSLAINTALSYQYKKGHLNVIGGDTITEQPTNSSDLSILDIIKQEDKSFEYHTHIIKKFIAQHNYQDKRLLFITHDIRNNLLRFTEQYQDKIDIIDWEGIEVNDILKASRIFIELGALKSLALKQAENLHLKE
ncbi:hypothetical protein RI543_003056 [Arxiozyma heterogenica]|uniref:Large ribosomal subunit protein uL4m n=2 Tax=Arxiozyma heterogenica TaxID=278026 RepID=A0AAN8A7T4_9SACH|nr:hypothetical protein RI543_003056 [Kazachstania heterogenica]